MKLAATALLLDLDGTLIDSKPGIMTSYRFAAETVLPGQAYDTAAVVVGPPLPKMFATSFPQSSELQIDSLVKTFRDHYAREGLFKTVLYDGAIELLDLCRQRGIELHIATNKPIRLSTSILEYLKIAQFFRSVLAVDSTIPPFPGKSAMIQHLLSTYHLSAMEAIYVGDTAEDAAAAAACGVRFIWASWGYGTLAAIPANPPFHTAKNLGELADILK